MSKTIQLLEEIKELLQPSKKIIPEQIGYAEIAEIYQKHDQWFRNLKSKHSLKLTTEVKNRKVLFNSKEVIETLKKLGYELNN